MLAEAAVINLVDLALALVTSEVLSAGVSVNTLQLRGAMLFGSERSATDIAAAAEVVSSISECTSCDAPDF